MKRYLVSLLAALALASPSFAAPITLGQSVTSVSAGQINPAGPGAYSGNLVNDPGLAYSNTYLLDMVQYNSTQLTAQALYSSTTFSNASVVDGRKSSGTITVNNYAALLAASATVQITVTTNAFGSLPTLIFANCSLTMGRDFSRGSTKLATAQNLAAAIHSCNSLIAAAAAPSAVIYATATAGSYANSYAFTSNNSSVTISAATMSGGQDNGVLTINGVALTQGSQYSAVTSSAVTAANLATAITASALGATLAVSSNVGAAYGIITLASKLNGTTYNYAITSSNSGALTVKDGANLIGGLDSGFTLSSQRIVATGSTGLTTALPLLYAVGSNPAIGGLTTGTTYYAVPFSATGFYLAKYSTSAVAGLSADYVTITSTTSGTSQNTYTFAPLAITGTPGFKWQVSNDNSSWDDLAVSSITVSSYSTPPAVASWGFGTLGYRYIRLNVTAPTTGGLYLKVPVQMNR